MIRILMIGAAVAAASAVPLAAEEVREHVSQVTETGVPHQGREYTVHGVKVIEGAPRWTRTSQTHISRDRETFDLGAFFQMFD